MKRKKYRTKMCKDLETSCKKGEKCNFAHSKEQLRKVGDPFPWEIEWEKQTAKTEKQTKIVITAEKSEEKIVVSVENVEKPLLEKIVDTTAKPAKVVDTPKKPTKAKKNKTGSRGKKNSVPRRSARLAKKAKFGRKKHK